MSSPLRDKTRSSAPGWMLSSTPAFGVNHAVHTKGEISDLIPWDDGDPSGITSHGEQGLGGDLKVSATFLQ